MFDLIGDVRDDLYGLAQIIAAPLFLNHVLIDPSGGDIIGLVRLDIQEPLVMPQIQICFVPIDGYITLPVLVRIECARIYVDIRIQLLNGYPKTAGLQQFA